MLARVSSRLHDVRVSPLPVWLDAARLLGPTPFALRLLADGSHEAFAQLPARDAAQVAARLRGLGFDGIPLEMAIEPALPRSLVRAARVDEARARRDVSPGFTLRFAKLDEEARFSLTPEALALELGQRARGLRVIDACCGGGGNSIGFARAGCTVTAIEIDGARAADARHNARLYGVADRVTVREGDARELLPTLSGDLVFIDPPWGRDYDKRAIQLDDLPLLGELLPLCTGFPRTWIKVPASFATRQIPSARAEAMFGAAPGDMRRIKFVLMSRGD